MSVSSSSIRWLGRLAAVGAAFALGWWSRDAGSPVARPTPAPPALLLPASAAPVAAVASRPNEKLAASIDSLVVAAQRGPSRAARLAAFARELDRLAPADYAGLLRALRATNSPERPEAFAMLFDRWARVDGAATFAAARTLVATDGQHAALHAAVAAWAAVDPEAARAALQSAGLDRPASDEMAALLRGWASGDRAGAEAYLCGAAGAGEADAVPASVARGYEAVACARIAEDPSGALAWYRALSESWQTRLRQTMAAELTVAQPALAGRWLQEDAAAQLGTSDLLPLVRALGLEGFERPFAWAQSLANAGTRASALAAVIRERAAADLPGLGEWLASRHDDVALAPAFSLYAAHVVRTSPAAAVSWALAIDDPMLRQRTLEAVALEWRGRDPRAARQWATESNLIDWAALAR